MPSTARRALPAVLLFLTLVSAQTCFYPDGSISSDSPCSYNVSASACCSDQSYCMEGGLCLTGGLITRGSCTDRSWNDQACADFCQNVATDAEIGITPCSAGVSTNTYVCGLNNQLCNDTANTFAISSDTQLVLRPAQVAILLQEATSSDTPSSTSSPLSSNGSSAGAIAGAVVGVAVPLLIALAAVSYLLYREKKKTRRSQMVYKFPEHDETKESLTIHPPPSLMGGRPGYVSHSSHGSRASSQGASDRGSMRTVYTTRSQSGGSPRIPTEIQMGGEVQRPMPVRKPIQNYPESARSSHITSLAERIESMKLTPQLVEVHRDSGSSRHELDSSPSTPRSPPLPTRMASSERYPTTPKEVERFELATSRMSRG